MPTTFREKQHVEWTPAFCAHCELKNREAALYTLFGVLLDRGQAVRSSDWQKRNRSYEN